MLAVSDPLDSNADIPSKLSQFTWQLLPRFFFSLVAALVIPVYVDTSFVVVGALKELHKAQQEDDAQEEVRCDIRDHSFRIVKIAGFSKIAFDRFPACLRRPITRELFRPTSGVRRGGV